MFQYDSLVTSGNSVNSPLESFYIYEEPWFKDMEVSTAVHLQNMSSMQSAAFIRHVRYTFKQGNVKKDWYMKHEKIADNKPKLCIGSFEIANF